MSVTCRSTDPRRSSAGFTLLEMVVVLAIMALVAGIAAVRVFTLVGSWRERTTLESIEQQFERLPVLARQRGEDIVLPPSAASTGTPAEAGSTAAVVLPEDWMVHFSKPLRVRGSGLCEGAHIVVQHDQRRYPFHVMPPYCRLAPETGEARP